MKIFGAVLSGLLAVSAASAGAQSYPERPRSGTADRIARGAEAAAETIGTVADAMENAMDRVRYRGPERWAVEACEARAQRYGRVSIDDVERYKRSSLRVYGVADPSGGYSNRDRYDRSYRYDRRYRPVRFACTVRRDGRVTRFKTSRIRY
jgi:hypothetical protein